MSKSFLTRLVLWASQLLQSNWLILEARSESTGTGEGSETKEALGRTQPLPSKRGTSTHGTLGDGPTSIGVSKAFINHAVSKPPAICQNPTHQLLSVGKHEGAKPRYLCLQVQRKSQLGSPGRGLTWPLSQKGQLILPAMVWVYPKSSWVMALIP